MVKVSNNAARSQRCVCPNEPNEGLLYEIKALRVGSVQIQVTAKPIIDEYNQCTDTTYKFPPPIISKQKLLAARDSISKTLIIKSPGQNVKETFSRLVCIDRVDYQEEIGFTIPTNMIAGSRQVFFSGIGDILGPAINNLQQLVEEPMGCGEQNLARLLPNVLILEYLNVSRQLQFDHELQHRLLFNIKQGYKNQVNYFQPDGSFSIFPTYCNIKKSVNPYEMNEAPVLSPGKCDATAFDESSSWLTAFSIRVLSMASKVGLYLFPHHKNACQRACVLYYLIGFIPRLLPFLKPR